MKHRFWAGGVRRERGTFIPPLGEPRPFTSQPGSLQSWQPGGPGLPAPGKPLGCRNAGTPSSTSGKQQRWEKERAGGGRAGGRRRGAMPRRVMCMLSSLCRSIPHGGLSLRRSGPGLPSREKFVVGDTQAPSLPTPQPPAPRRQPPAPHRLGFQSPPEPCCSAPRQTGDEAGLVWTFPAFGGHVGAALR